MLRWLKKGTHIEQGLPTRKTPGFRKRRLKRGHSIRVSFPGKQDMTELFSEDTTSTNTPPRHHKNAKTPLTHNQGTTQNNTKQPPKSLGPHQGTTVNARPKDHQDATETLPKHLQDTGKTPASHHQHTKTPAKDERDTTETPVRHRDALRPGRQPRTQRRPSASRLNKAIGIGKIATESTYIKSYSPPQGS